jgi:hypothetical protein
MTIEEVDCQRLQVASVRPRSRSKATRCAPSSYWEGRAGGHTTGGACGAD